jgi:hypothetical protein
VRTEESSELSSRSASGTDCSGKWKGEDDEAKRRAAGAQSRERAPVTQRKKQYMEEMEGNVKTMQATIADLSARLSCMRTAAGSLPAYT